MIKLNERLKKKTGFTLIELMIVVAIIGILAAIAIPNFLRFQAKSKQSEARILLSGIYTSETAYFAEQNTYSTRLQTNVGFQPASALKYYNRGGILLTNVNGFVRAAGSSSFSAQCSGNIDSDGTFDVWKVDQASREPLSVTNDVVLN